MSDQPNHEREIFEAALELNSAEARSAYLRDQCVDAGLRARVETLLRAHERVGGFLPAEDARTQAAASAKTIGITMGMVAAIEKPGDRIGRYKLREKIGEGGCGVVYVAEQEEPVRRRVALKVIKLGMDTKSVIARFGAERQALAMMDHPNIAKVLDAGATDTGRPYFVMELVRGIRITDYCDQNRISPRERLNLFIQVCHAIQHAHQKGIIHRDIKPSNILVTLHDGVPVPKVIDFGIAKATEGRLTDGTVYTELHQFIGTPAYMSPEQAEMSGLDIDTRSDIYSLGVLLYELLTGQTPFDAKELMSQGIDAMRKTIREQEPMRPSTKLSQTLVAADVRRLKSPATGTPVSEDEIRASSRRLLRLKETIALLRGDLDWIVMKSLEKDRTRRYDTANGLAMDIRRHLSNEPIVARSPSNLYRFQKLVRRNKLAFAAVGAIAAVLILGVIVSTWQAIRATRAEGEQSNLRHHAEANEQKAHTAQAGEAKERAFAEQRLYNSLLGAARATRAAHRVGYRDQAFDLLKQAHALRVPQTDLNELRCEAVACLGDFAGLAPTTLTDFPTNTEIRSMVIDPTGQLAAFTLDDGSMLLRKLPTGDEVAHLKGEHPSSGCVFSAAGDQIFSLHAQGGELTLQAREAVPQSYIWARGVDGHWREAEKVALPPEAVSIMASAKGFFAVVADSESHSGKLINLKTKAVVQRFELSDEALWPSLGPVAGIDSSPDDHLLAVARWVHPDGNNCVVIDLWDLRTGQRLTTFEPGLGPLAASCFSADGKHLSFLMSFGCALYSTDGFELEALFKKRFEWAGGPYQSTPSQISFASRKTVLALPLVQNNRVRLWDWAKDQDFAVLEEPETSYEAVFAPDDSFLLTCGLRRAQLYRLDQTAEKLSFPGFVGFAGRVAFSPDGARLASVGGGDDPTVRVCDAVTGQKVWEQKISGANKFCDVAYSPDGRWLVTTDVQTRRFCVWDGRNNVRAPGPPLVLGTNEPGSIGSAQFSADGRYLATSGSPGSQGTIGGGSGEINVWAIERHTAGNIESGFEAKFVKRETTADPRVSLVLAPDNQHLAYWAWGSGSAPQGIYVCELYGQAPPRLLTTECNHPYQRFCFTPDSRQLMIVGRNREVITLDLATGKTVSTFQTINPKLPLELGAQPQFSLSPDGTKLAVTSASSSGLDIRDPKTGHLTYSLPGLDGAITWVAWSPDSQRLAVSRSNGEVAVWSLTLIDQILAKLGLNP